MNFFCLFLYDIFICSLFHHLSLPALPVFAFFLATLYVISWNCSHKLVLNCLLGAIRPQSLRANNVLYIYSRGPQIPDARSPGRLNFISWLLIFLDTRYRTFFISPFCRLEFWGVLPIFWQIFAPVICRVLLMRILIFTVVIPYLVDLYLSSRNIFC